MKKILLSLLLATISVVSFGQENDSIQTYESILCDCHSEFYDGYIFGYKNGSRINNDTILFFGYINVFNDYIDKRYSLLHYDVGSYSANDKVDLTKLKRWDDISDTPELVAYHNYNVYLEKISKDFKYGFIKKWSWSTNSVNGIDFKISYTNTNSKAIKYIDIYFIIKNPVGDVCRILYNGGSNTGHLRCVGPIEQFQTGTYSWDAVYYTTGDASDLYFTKFVITYMDNTKYTLVKELAYKY